MDWSGIAAAGMAAAGVVAAAALQVWRTGGDRGAIKANLEVLEKLPPESQQRGALSKHIDDQVEALIGSEVHTRRDGFGISLAVIFLLCGIYGLVEVRRAHGWLMWGGWLVVIFLLIFGVAGLSISFPKQRRDEKGNAVKGP